MRSIVENLKKSELYGKCIEILGYMKTIYETILYDYDEVSRVLVRFYLKFISLID